MTQFVVAPLCFFVSVASKAPTREQKDLRQLLIHRYKLVGLRARVKNELQHLAMNQGVTKKGKLWSRAGEKVLRELPLAPWASQRRKDLFRVREMLDEQMDVLDRAVVEAAEKNEKARLLMTQREWGRSLRWPSC